ncbi:MAG: hypothetical protein U0797_26770 [Gemmataceae bacterium]
MGPMFGMAGLAEAAEAFSLLLGYGGLSVVGLAAGVTLLAPSRAGAAVALVVAGTVSLLFLPWEAFWPTPSVDPDAQHWAAAWHRFALWWCLALAATLAAAVRAFGAAAPAEPN